MTIWTLASTNIDWDFKETRARGARSFNSLESAQDAMLREVADIIGIYTDSDTSLGSHEIHVAPTYAEAYLDSGQIEWNIYETEVEE